MLGNLPQDDWESLPTAIEEFTSEIIWETPPDVSPELSSETSGEALSQDTTSWADLEMPKTEFTQEIELESPSADLDSESSLNHSAGEISFQGAGACWWCGGTGVVWSGGENQKCPQCGGSGIGAT